MTPLSLPIFDISRFLLTLGMGLFLGYVIVVLGSVIGSMVRSRVAILHSVRSNPQLRIGAARPVHQPARPQLALNQQERAS